MAGKTIDLGKVRGNDAVYGVVNTTADGLAPKTGGASAGKYLRADATWQVPPDTTYTGSSLKMTGYAKGSDKSTVITSDSVNQAVGKLENRIDEQSINLTVQTVSPSFSIPVIRNLSRIWKYGKVVVFNINFQPTNEIPRYTIFGTIPNGFRPYNGNIQHTIASSGGGPNAFVIDESGQLSFVGNSPAEVWMTACITYICK